MSNHFNALQNIEIKYLTKIMPMLHSYRNQSIDLHCESIDGLLYECNVGLIWVKTVHEFWKLFCFYIPCKWYI